MAANPATGLPMTDGGIDVAGNPFGTNLADYHWHYDWHHDTHHIDWHDGTAWSGGTGGGHDLWRA